MANIHGGVSCYAPSGESPKVVTSRHPPEARNGSQKVTDPVQKPRRSIGSAFAVIGSILAFAAIAGVILSANGRSDKNIDTSFTFTTPPATTSTTAAATSNPPTTTEPSTTTLQPVGKRPSEIAKATVLLTQLDDNGEQVCFSGSGTVIDPTGLILTNAHVVMSDPTCGYSKLGVEITTRTDTLPELRYIAEVAGYDPALDLATVRIVTDIDGNPVEITDLPFLALGDSEALEVGDKITMVGYPAIGGITVTVTEGIISGFAGEPGVAGNRAWIKTDATISGGNSGGAATYSSGRLIGVPTTAGITGELAVDCRVLEDTNGDGVVNDSDTCVPIGGFLNGLRPINLASNVITAALDGAVSDEWKSSGNTDPTSVLDTADAYNVVFSPSVLADDTPSDVVLNLPGSATQVCAFWDYDGMADGASYDAVWLIDGTVNENVSYFNTTWAGGASGSWWACMTNPQGIGSHAVEFEFQVEGQLLVSDAIYVGDNHSPVDLTVNNNSSTEVCGVFATPSSAADWGLNEMFSDESLLPGSALTVPVTTGRWDILFTDCNPETLDEIEGIEITTDTSVAYPSGG